MTKKKVSILVLLFLLSTSEMVCAEPSGLRGDPGSVNRNSPVLLGYDGSYLNLKECSTSSVLDKDTGRQNGFDPEAGFEAGKLCLRTLFAYSSSNKATCCGSLDGYTPVNVTIKENFFQYEAALGYRLRDISASGLTRFSGIGYRDRDWDRSSNSLTGYLEPYTWYYSPFGVNYVLTIDADAAVQFAFSMKMEPGMGGPAAMAKPSFSERTEIVAVATSYYRYTCWY